MQKTQEDYTEQIAQLPEQRFTCPDCCRIVTIQAGKISTGCACGQIVFRPW